jgi:ribonuclease P protein subunit RPR2
VTAPGNGDNVGTLRAQLERTERQASARQNQLERYAADLREVFKQERSRAQELRESYKATVRALSNAVEARDAYTGKHAERVTAYGIALARATGLNTDSLPEIEFGFLLHDVGKVGVPDAILFKPGALSKDEFALIAQHPVIGSEILRDVDFLGEGKLVVRHHHERWDGAGYPDRLAGDEIPLAARVFAVADALDALTTDRPYRRDRASTFSAWTSRSAPAAVSSTPLEVRRKSARPSSASSLRICCESAGWVTYSSSAARVKCLWRATAAKYWSWRSSIRGSASCSRAGPPRSGRPTARTRRAR